MGRVSASASTRQREPESECVLSDIKDQYDFTYNPNAAVSFADQCLWFQQRLAERASEVVKTRHSFGKVFTLSMTPAYFLAKHPTGFVRFDASQADLKPVYFTEEDWFKEHQTKTKTKERYHPAYKNLCPVLRNAPKNPVILQSVEGLREGEAVAVAVYLSKIVVTQLKDGCTQYDFETQNVQAFAGMEGGTIDISKGKHYRLSFEPMAEHHSPHRHPDTLREGQLCIDGVITTRAADLIEMLEVLGDQFLHKRGYSLHKAYVSLHRFIDYDLAYWWSGRDRKINHNGYSVAQTVNVWYEELKANPAFYDLPYTEIQLLELFNNLKHAWQKEPELAQSVRESILAPLLAGDTKTAVNACFFGYSFPPAIKKLLLKTGLLTYPKHVYAAIHHCVEKAGVDKTLLFISDVHKAGKPDLGIIDNCMLLGAVAEGFNIDVIKRLQRSDDAKTRMKLLNEKFRLIEDTMTMYERLQQANVPLVFDSKNINHAHDYLANIYTFHANTASRGEMNAVETIDTSEQSIRYEAGGYIIRSPYTASELVQVGIAMRHCVAVYIQKFYYRQIDILLLTNTDGDYLACIEVFDGHVMQAKLKYNRRLHSNSEYLEVVADYIKANNLMTTSIDLGDSFPAHPLKNTLLPKKDSKRVGAVMALEEHFLG